MLTPAFDLSQDPDFLTIAIRVPYARVSEFDVYFKGVDFKFYAKPYFLRLTLPGRIIENGSEQGSYDADKGLFTIQLPKETPGQHFEGLNMLTALLAPRKSRTAKPLVEEIGTSSVSEEGGEYDDEEFDWEIEQFPYEEVSESALKLQCHYGFGDLRSGVFQRLQVESAWNIRKLSPTLCWFETWTNVHEILVAFGRRVLCYPLYRHFKLVLKAYRDTTEILQLGKSAVLKCLLDVHKIFQESDPAYILNDLYISDYCVWIQKAKSKKLAALAEALEEVSLTKAQLGLELEELEAAALLVQEEEAALTAAHSTPRQQTPPSGSEAGALEEPDSSIPSETEDSGSEPEVLKARKSKTVSSLRGLFIEDSSALLVNHDGVCREVALLGSDASQEKPLASAWAPGGSRPLIEELEEH
ncbi:SHQ1, H/ACA ribonucleoprotein assembly factor [Rhinolophus ferrumequinum]|uniref:Protein SHQ1 homolog n=1 Tax=Rhinolophus ferrumequinum TaxID=59479 RepID=A0A7J7UKV8_RHIFE|nr:SHQ1, H/ACA ribonucleoprotein assembly factor [Rhinolophus ferrumequinum]